MKLPNPFLFALYRNSLRLYPHRLRLLYQDQLLQTARDAYADSNSSLYFWPSLFADLLKSAVKEHLLMIRDQAIARPIFFHALTLGIILTLFGAFAAFVFQALLRRGANEPQAQTAALYASRIASGANPGEAIPSNYVDLERSLEPFVIFYSDQGAPLTATGYLNQVIPLHPPASSAISAPTPPTPSPGSRNPTYALPRSSIESPARTLASFSPAGLSASSKSRKRSSAKWSSAAGSLSSFFYSQERSSSAASSNLPLAWYAAVREREESRKYESAPCPECEP